MVASLPLKEKAGGPTLKFSPIDSLGAGIAAKFPLPLIVKVSFMGSPTETRLVSRDEFIDNLPIAP